MKINVLNEYKKKEKKIKNYFKNLYNTPNIIKKKYKKLTKKKNIYNIDEKDFDSHIENENETKDTLSKLKKQKTKKKYVFYDY